MLLHVTDGLSNVYLIVPLRYEYVEVISRIYFLTFMRYCDNQIMFAFYHENQVM